MARALNLGALPHGQYIRTETFTEVDLTEAPSGEFRLVSHGYFRQGGASGQKIVEQDCLGLNLQLPQAVQRVPELADAPDAAFDDQLVFGA